MDSVKEEELAAAQQLSLLGNPRRAPCQGCTPHTAQRPHRFSFCCVQAPKSPVPDKLWLWQEHPGFRDPRRVAAGLGGCSEPSQCRISTLCGCQGSDTPQGQLWTGWVWALSLEPCRTTQPSSLSPHSCQDTPKTEPHIWDSLR